MNRNVKGPLESAILEKAKECEHTYIVQGPIWSRSASGRQETEGILGSGQWIPGKFFVSALFLSRKKSTAYAWVMRNDHNLKHVCLREASLDALESMTGLYLWSSVASGDFNARRDQTNDDDWWKKGQPSE